MRENSFDEVDLLESAQLRIGIWKSMLGCSDASPQMERFYRSIALGNTQEMKAVLDDPSVFPGIWSEFGNALAFYFVNRGDMDTVKYLIAKRCNFGITLDVDTTRNYVPRFDDTPLQHAVAHGYTNMVKLFLAAGLNMRDDDLVVAASKLDKGMVLIALENGCNINGAANYGWNALDVACSDGSEDMFNFLLAHGAKISKSDTDLLFNAVGARNLAITKVLLDSGLDPNARHKERGEVSMGDPVFIHAVYPGNGKPGNMDVIRLLVERGADPHVRDSEGKTALDIIPQDRRDFAPLVSYLKSL